jgi:hypothetical protein
MFDFLKSLIGIKSTSEVVAKLKKESKKTKRGRPKKTTPVVSEAPKKRGRPKKAAVSVVEQIVEQVVEVVVPVIEEPAKKKRGRPRKK